MVGVWISGDAHYAFVDFKTAEDATQAFALQQVSIHGNVSFILFIYSTLKLGVLKMQLALSQGLHSSCAVTLMGRWCITTT